MFGLKTDDAVVQHHKTTLEGKLAAYDVILGKTQYLAGDVSATQFGRSYMFTSDVVV